MDDLDVLRGWMKEFGDNNPNWGDLVNQIIKDKLYTAAIPAAHGHKDGGVEDTDMLVYEMGCKGPPHAFRLLEGKLYCVNYPGPVKQAFPFSWILYLKDIVQSGKVDIAGVRMCLDGKVSNALEGSSESEPKKHCPSHGPKEGLFCDFCGVKLLDTTVGAIVPFEMSGKNPCPFCGYDLNHGHQNFCPGCGHVLKWTCR